MIDLLIGVVAFFLWSWPGLIVYILIRIWWSVSQD
jgi:hypothetical protein